MADQSPHKQSVFPATNKFSAPVLRIATTLARLQGTSRATVVVPRCVSVAHMELLSATKIAQSVLRKEDRAKEKLIGKLGGEAPVDGSLGGGESRKYHIPPDLVVNA